MVDKRFQYNHRYWVDSHRTLSESYRDVEYACAISTFERESSSSAISIVVAILGSVLVAIIMSIDPIVTPLNG